MTDLDDILRERLSVPKLDRDRDKAALDHTRAAERTITALGECFSQMVRTNVAPGEIPFRKIWIQSIASRSTIT